MRFGSVVALAALTAACSAGVNGECKSDTDCKPGSVCDPSQSVCVVPNGGCFPKCPAGKICLAATCQSSQCTPPCNASEACDLNSATCKPVTAPTVALTSPGANSFTGLTLQATADARAPGGVNGVDFQIRTSGTTTVLAHAAGAPTTSGGANFAATISLNGGGIPDGPVDLVAVLSYPTGSLASAALPIKVDLTAPAFSGGSVSPAWVGPQAANATIAVGISDSGAGVDPATVLLTLTGVSHAPYPGTAATGNSYTFTVPLADLGVAAGSQGSVPFKLNATDLVGNAAAAYTGQAFEVIQVDRVPPVVGVTADSAWHAASQTVSVQGTASDAQSGIVGGASGVKLTGGTFNQAGTITGGNYSISADLSTQVFGATEAAFPIAVTLTDAAGNTLSQAGSLNVDNKPPQISAIAITTGADCLAATCGHDFYKAGGGSVTVTATITDSGAGVDGSTVFLKPAATGANTTFTAVAGVAGASNSWSFTLPRTVGNGLDGSSPVQFLIAANDTLAAAAIPDAANHRSVSAPVSLYFDDAPPTLNKAVDLRWYARKVGVTDVTITVHATIADPGSNIKSTTLTVFDANTSTVQTVAGTAGTAGDFTFPLDAAYLLANNEGTLSFTLNAQDNLSSGPTDLRHATTVTDSRKVDGKPPAVTITQIINNSATTTNKAPQVAYPDTLANTGYDGSHFLYSDTVHITGTIADAGAGISVNAAASPPSPNFQVNGIMLGSTTPGSAPGPNTAILTCADGAATCSFAADVKLSDLAKVGPFHAADNALQVIINSADKAVDGAGAPAGNSGASAAVNATVTRFWWKSVLSAANVSGLAVYPVNGASNVGDVIATVAAGSGDSVYSIYRNGPFHPTSAIAWHKGLAFYGASDLGSVQGAPTIGAAATTPNIYVATAGGDVVSFSSTGTTAWNCGAGNLIDPTHQTPAIVQASKVGSLAGCEAVITGSDNKRMWATCGTAANSCSPRSANVIANGSSPVVALGGNYYAGAGHSVAVVSLDGTGGITAGGPSTTADASVFNSVITDGSELYAFNDILGKVYAINPALTTFRYTKILTNAVNGAPLLLQSGATTPGLLFNEADANVYTLGLTTATPTETAVAALANAASTSTAPVLGSDNRIYTDAGGAIVALNQRVPPFSTDWSYPVGVSVTFNGPLTMDCGGVLYAASAGTVYAFITDAQGLGVSPWPKYQRDTRNSGNADAATLWGANAGGSCTQ